tara:strand:- start:177 stop:542 length:366 start_codon:yes stop_codon:yes gene_type:complete
MSTLNHLEELKDLEAALAESSSRPVMLFKHSSRCPVSHSANRNFLSFADGYEAEDVAFYHLDLIRFRHISNAIADRLGVQHESPQALLVVNGQAVWHTSHSIPEKALDKAIQSALYAQKQG